MKSVKFYDSPLTPNSRTYLKRMGQPDSIIPDLYNHLDYNRYAFVRWNSVKYSDPTGHECFTSESGNTYCTDDSNSYDFLEDQGYLVDNPYDQPEKSEAEEIWEEFAGECDRNCAYYVSLVLHAYGLSIYDGEYGLYWKPDCANENWSNAAFLFDFLTNDLGFMAIPLPMTPNRNIRIPEGSPIFYNDGSYNPADFPSAANFEEAYRFNHVAVVTRLEFNSKGHVLPVVLDVENPNVSGKHFYNEVQDTSQTIWVVLIDVYAIIPVGEHFAN